MEAASPTAAIRALARVDPTRAEDALADLIRELFAIEPRDLRINADAYSLNSLNGFFDADGGSFFFKFHQEDGEEAMSGEYYRAEILACAGMPVDLPVHISRLPGEQMLIYRRRDDPRFADVLRALDLRDDAGKRRRAVEAERALCRRLLDIYVRTLHPVTAEQVAAEPIHRLFHDRLVDPRTRRAPGGRLADYYFGKTFRFPGLELDWAELARARFVINGRSYAATLGELFQVASERLCPARLADHGGVVAHGDAHNANVWYAERGERAELCYFDPAFAGEHVPALLAEIKPSFHNIFAHPFWLYEPAVADQRFHAGVSRRGDTLHVEMDWDLTPIRRALLELRAAEIWRPLLGVLAERRMLPADWRQVIRLGLFLCPTLVMNLRAGAASHTPKTSLIGFSLAVMAGAGPENGGDAVSAFLDLIAPH